MATSMNSVDFENENLNQIMLQKNYKISNYILGAVYKSTLTENRILFLALCKTDESFEDAEGSIIVRMTENEMQKLIGTSGNYLYKSIRDAADNLQGGLRIAFESPERKCFKFVSLIESASFEYGVLELRFAREIKPFLKEIKKNYTRLSAETMMNFKSVYSFRLYEILKSMSFSMNKSIKSTKFVIEMGLPELKLKLGVVNSNETKVREILNSTGKSGQPDYELAEKSAIEKKYKSWNAFKTRVIDVAINEINEKPTGMEVEYELITGGKGGAVKGLRFITKLTEVIVKDTVDESIVEEEVAEVEFLTIDDLADEVREIAYVKIKTSNAKAILSAANKNLEDIKLANDYAKAHQIEEGYVGYMIKTLENRWFDRTEIKKSFDVIMPDTVVLSDEELMMKLV